MNECPKCGAPCSAEAVECARCGVVFAKLHHRADAAGAGITAPEAVTPREAPADPARSVVRFVRAIVLAGLVVWTWSFASAPLGDASESVLHLPNLVFHEAGHVVFGFFGRFMTVLGGSLFQFLVPMILAGAFLRQRDQFGAVVCTWWAGENLLDLAPYIADARALQLVLLGGKTGAEVEGHDWEFLLTRLGWLQRDVGLGLAARRIGLAMMAGALAWGAIYLARNSREPVAPLEGMDS